MAYQISYFHDRAMSRPAADSDQIGSIDRYPAPTGSETAVAIHSHDPSLTRYGYDGAWHSSPTPEAGEYDRRKEAREEADRAEREHLARKFSVGDTVLHDEFGRGRVVSVSGRATEVRFADTVRRISTPYLSPVARTA